MLEIFHQSYRLQTAETTDKPSDKPSISWMDLQPQHYSMTKKVQTSPVYSVLLMSAGRNHSSTIDGDGMLHSLASSQICVNNKETRLPRKGVAHWGDNDRRSPLPVKMIRGPRWRENTLRENLELMSPRGQFKSRVLELSSLHFWWFKTNQLQPAQPSYRTVLTGRMQLMQQ